MAISENKIYRPTHEKYNKTPLINDLIHLAAFFLIVFFVKILNQPLILYKIQQQPMSVDEHNHTTARDRKINSIIHTLPKAIEIFQVLQHHKKSIYPFQMITKTHKLMKIQQQPYSKQQPQKIGIGVKFTPALETVNAHFQRPFLIYDKFNNNQDQQLFNQNIFSIQKLKNLKNIDYMTNVEYTQCYQSSNKSHLRFNSRFQSGNLSMASFVQDVYCLLLHNDVNTCGYTSWFYFSAFSSQKGRHRFAILNYGKAGVMHNQGVKICVYDKSGWKRGGQNLICQPNRSLFRKGHYLNFNTLYFQYEFEEDNSEVYFSYNIPYTYNDLCCFLNEMQDKNFTFFNRKLAGISLAGNRLQMITLTNFSLLNQGVDLPVIVIMARSHPGETVSSWIMHQLINFLVSNQPEANTLRNNFVFKLFPMLNPDGVIHGNYRCSLSGRDLNRRWGQFNKQLFPEVYFVKNQILDISRRRCIKAIIDLHGHTKKKKVFAYGCNNRNEPHRCRLFPYIFSKLTPYFQFRFCNYYLNKYKFGTARISLYNQLRIPYIYTIETSQFGTIEGHLSLKVFNEVAVNLGKSFLILFRIKIIQKNYDNQNNQQIDYQKFDKIETELINDASLTKFGSQRDSGSESEPSVDNIKFDKLEQMSRRRQKKVSTKRQQRVKISNQKTLSLEKLKNTIMIRPKTTETKAYRFLQDQPKQLIKPIQIFEKKINLKNKTKYDRTVQKKVQKRKQLITKPTSVNVKRRTQALNFINLSLSVFDDKNVKSQRTTSAVAEKEFGQNYFKKNRIAPRNYFHFRRMK